MKILLLNIQRIPKNWTNIEWLYDFSKKTGETVLKGNTVSQK